MNLHGRSELSAPHLVYSVLYTVYSKTACIATYTRYTRCIATYTPTTRGDAPSVYYTPIHQVYLYIIHAYTLYTYTTIPLIFGMYSWGRRPDEYEHEYM